LLKQGAKLVESAQDILEELGSFQSPVAPAAASAAQDQQAADPSGQSAALLEHLGFDPVDVDTLSARSGLTVSQLSAMLLSLELNGRICALPGGLYQRIR
jgi:DNA processing protein